MSNSVRFPGRGRGRGNGSFVDSSCQSANMASYPRGVTSVDNVTPTGPRKRGRGRGMFYQLNRTQNHSAPRQDYYQAPITNRSYNEYTNQVQSSTNYGKSDRQLTSCDSPSTNYSTACDSTTGINLSYSNVASNKSQKNYFQ